MGVNFDVPLHNQIRGAKCDLDLQGPKVTIIVQLDFSVESMYKLCFTCQTTIATMHSTLNLVLFCYDNVLVLDLVKCKLEICLRFNLF